MVLGKSKEHAFKGFGVELSAVFFRNVDVCLASKNMDQHNIRLVSAPSFLMCYVMVKGLCGDNVVQVHCILHCFEPEGVWETGIEEEGMHGLD